MTRIAQTYPLKLPQEVDLRQNIDLLRDIVLQASQQLLDRLWSEEWLDRLAAAPATKKAYKIIAEQVGRILLIFLIVLIRIVCQVPPCLHGDLLSSGFATEDGKFELDQPKEL